MPYFSRYCIYLFGFCKRSGSARFRLQVHRLFQCFRHELDGIQYPVFLLFALYGRISYRYLFIPEYQAKNGSLGSLFVYGIFYSSHPDPGYQESGHRLRMFRGCPDLNQLGNFLEKYHNKRENSRKNPSSYLHA